MDVQSNSSTDDPSNGMAIFELDPIWPWPPVERIPLLHQPISTDEAVHAWLDIDGSFAIEWLNSLRKPQSVRSPALILSEPLDLKVAIGWSDRGFTIACNGDLILTPEANNAPQNVLVKPRVRTEEPDRSSENEAALQKRQADFVPLRIRPGRSAGTPDHLRNGLIGEVKQIEELLSLHRGGSRHHIAGISSRLRTLLAHKGQKPLLQAYAAQRDAALLIYPNVASQPYDDRDHLAVIFPPAVEARPTAAPIDIDVWLTWEGARLGANTYSNEQVLCAYADTRGSHFDPGLHEVVGLMEQRKGRYTTAEVWMDRLGGLTLDLAKCLLR